MRFVYFFTVSVKAVIWYDFAARLPKQYRAIIINLRGHGDYFAEDKNNYNIIKYSSDIVDMVCRYNLNNISLIGHSLGASVAIKVASNIPDRIRNLVLVDFSLSAKPAIHENIMSQFREQCDGFGSPAEYARWLSDKRPLTHPRMIPHIVSNALRETPEGRFVLKVDPAIKKIINNVSKFQEDYKSILSEILCRTLLIRGRGSAILSKKEAMDIVKILKDGELQEISGAGHAVMTDNPDQFSETVNRFLVGSRS
ncbi:alpha/beta fold hydrolase [Sphingopyxis kveilinensis]|uniref:alpha/beta fold hydrolase n=1 Tax=Sphingopyxis kveilinensis TaxID=3114367 RepID=UPI0030D561A4